MVDARCQPKRNELIVAPKALAAVHQKAHLIHLQEAQAPQVTAAATLRVTAAVGPAVDPNQIVTVKYYLDLHNLIYFRLF